MIDPQAGQSFRRVAIITVYAVYFLILVGGIVRASGAGMGCPDWPTCFGKLIPPTQESQLPTDYHQRYIGYGNTQFNVIKTWTEYLNRLTGVTIGFLIFLTAWKSRIYRKYDRPIFYLSWAVFFLVGFQGWLGSTVVASNLKPAIITLHMLLAMVIVAMLIYVLVRSQKQYWIGLDVGLLPRKFTCVLLVAMVMTLAQVMMGSQVREAVDMIANEHKYIDRQFWRDDFPVIFYVHRSFSSLILVVNAWLCWKISQAYPRTMPIFKIGVLLVTLISCGIVAGISLDRLGMPPIAQPIHLLMANLIFGAQFFLFIYLRQSGSEKLKGSNS
jgi:heme a synthase